MKKSNCLKALLPSALALALCAPVTGAFAASAADVVLHDKKNQKVGTIAMRDTPHGVLMDVKIDGKLSGTHAFHIHETGECVPPFESAGGHFNPTNAGHGLSDPDGMHAGDLPNIHVPPSGLHVEILAPRVTLVKGKQNSLLDSDGSAVVIHQGADDYASDPAGDAGTRIACGIVEERK